MVKFIQGHWPCQILEELKDSYRYIPLEGYGPDQKGKTFDAPRYLFTDKTYPQTSKVASLYTSKLADRV